MYYLSYKLFCFKDSPKKSQVSQYGGNFKTKMESLKQLRAVNDCNH